MEIIQLGKSENEKKDNFNKIKQSQQQIGFDLILNDSEYLEKDGERIALIGVENWGNGLFATGFDVPNNSWEFADIALTTGTSDAKENGSYIYDNRLLSYFGRLQYDFKGKYLFSAMILGRDL